MSTVPKQVKAHADKARETLEQMKKVQQDAEAVVGEVAAAQPSASPAPSEPPAPSAPPEPPAPSAPPAPPAEEDWKHKYEVLQGKYSSEVPQLSEELRRTRGMVEKLQAELEEVRQAPPVAAPKNSSLVSQDEINEFGPELFDFVRRVARAEVLPEVEARLTTVKKTAETAATTATETAQMRFMEALLADPDFRQYNEDPGFLAWIAQVDPLVGAPRQVLLDQAVAAHNVQRVLAFFRAYKSGVAPPAAVQGDPRPTAADFVAPGGTPPATPGGKTEKKVWTKKEVEDFFSRNQRRTPFSDLTPEQAEKVRADITAATAEGRVRV